MSLLHKVDRIISVTLLVIGGVWLIAMMVVVVGNSVGRTLFKTPIYGAIEIAGLAGVIVVAAAVAFIGRERGNVSVEILMEKVKPGTREILNAINSFLSMVSVVFLLCAVLVDTLDAFDQRETAMITDISVVPFKFAWALGIFIVGCFLLQHLVEAIKKGGTK